jgi:hypothetical protein
MPLEVFEVSPHIVFPGPVRASLTVAFGASLFPIWAQTKSCIDGTHPLR